MWGGHIATVKIIGVSGPVNRLVCESNFNRILTGNKQKTTNLVTFCGATFQGRARNSTKDSKVRLSGPKKHHFSFKKIDGKILEPWIL